MNYDYRLFESIIISFMKDSFRDPDNLEIGEDISDDREVKIIFDGYGGLETEDEYIEGGDKNMESYAIFIHKDALTEDFEFPEHDTWFAIIHRPKEEVCIYAWYDVKNDNWDFLPLEDRLAEECAMNEQDVMIILEGLYKKNYSY